jgi:hypothetical protein
MSKKLKPIKITAYTYNAAVKKYADIKNTNHFKPDWHKELPVARDDDFYAEPNMKMCRGFNQVFNKGFVVPFWCDYKVRVGVKGDTDYEWISSSDDFNAVAHPQSQRGSYLPDTKYSHIKFDAPWLVSCDEDIEFLYAYNSWVSNSPEGMVIPVGVLDFKYNNGVNMNVFFTRGDKEKVYHVAAGEPFVQLIPLSDRPVEVETKVVSRSDYNMMHTESTMLKFRGTSYWKVKSASKECPFSDNNKGDK